MGPLWTCWCHRHWACSALLVLTACWEVTNSEGCAASYVGRTWRHAAGFPVDKVNAWGIRADWILHVLLFWHNCCSILIVLFCHLRGKERRHPHPWVKIIEATHEALMRSPKHPTITLMPVLCIKRDCNQVFHLSGRYFRKTACVLLWLELNKHSQACRKSVGVCWDSHLVPPSCWSLQNIRTSDNIPGANSSTCIWSTLALCACDGIKQRDRVGILGFIGFFFF